MSSLLKTKLPNGLTIQLKEIHSAPLISHWIWYRVGLRNEAPGKTGLSHWVEHMQFKGTPQLPAGVLDKAISRDGGLWNAFTYLDWTAYFETMPADKIDLAINLEADRMTNSLFDPQEVESERTVIMSEREGNENEPLFRLDEAIQAAAFERHPYRFEVVGAMEDLRTIQREDLYHHYRTYYVPANAVLAVAGDFKIEEMLQKITGHYGNIPAGQPPPTLELSEDELPGEKRVEVKGPGETTYLRLAYRAPAAAHKDFFTLTVLDSLLSGPSSLNMFGGGGISNKTSRLYRALVEKELAIGVNGALQATIDPFLYALTATVHPAQTPDAVLSAMDEQIDRLHQERISEEEIHRAVKQARALFAYGSENITNQAFWLGYSEMFSTYEWFTRYVQTLETITPEDVQRAAQFYLQTSRRVIGIYIPEDRQEKAA